MGGGLSRGDLDDDIPPYARWQWPDDYNDYRLPH
jgi:hypothetical protein